MDMGLYLYMSMPTFTVINNLGGTCLLNWVSIEFKLSYVLWLLFSCSSGMIDLKELSLVSGKAAWMAYLVSIYIDCIYQMSLINHRKMHSTRSLELWCWVPYLCLLWLCSYQSIEYIMLSSLLYRMSIVWMLMVLFLMLLYFLQLLPYLIVSGTSLVLLWIIQKIDHSCLKPL